MRTDIVLAGVGGQGILSVSQVICLAALRQGHHVKQGEIHGMSQRGGSVQAHLRLADREIHSPIIPHGQADIVLAVEPLEALRYLDFLRPGGTVVSSTAPVVNIPNYPPIEEVLARIAALDSHILVDADRLAKEAGNARASNMVVLGAVADLLPVSPEALEQAIEEIFARKSARIVEVNQRALRLGLAVARAYRDALARGVPWETRRRWVETVSGEEVSAGAAFGGALAGGEDLSAAERDAVAQVLQTVVDEGRTRLYEHEVYRLLQLVGGFTPPAHVFIPAGHRMDGERVQRLRGEQVVVKVVSPDIAHKSDVGGVVFVPKREEAINREIERLVREFEAREVHVAGTLVVEYVEPQVSGWAGELFVGLRWTPEFGPVVAAGIGGLDTEYLARTLRPEAAVARAPAALTSAPQFLELFRRTAAWEMVSGQVRGHRRLVSEAQLERCFRAFVALGRAFGQPRDDGLPTLVELEVNPFALVAQRMVPLDGRGRLEPVAQRKRLPRSARRIEKLLEPDAIAVMGVSAKRVNFGRIILRNIINAGFDRRRLYVVHESEESIDGVRCVRSIDDLPEAVDVLVVATGSQVLPDVVQAALRSGKVGAGILIPGGVGETSGSQPVAERLERLIHAARSRDPEAAVFLGANCLGVRSHPGRYDTFFVPADRMPARGEERPLPVALVAQSGAYLITRMSRRPALDPLLAVSVGNQTDATVSDLVEAVAHREDVRVIGVYVEGFAAGDGVAFCEAVRRAVAGGRQVVVYKAGRTEAGRSAAAGHTASLAGDYAVAEAAMRQAGAIVAQSLDEFADVVVLAAAIAERSITGRCVGVVSNAGYEVVAAADQCSAEATGLTLALLEAATRQRLEGLIRERGLEGLVEVRNPLDLTPMADDAAYEAAVAAMIDDPGTNAVVVGVVPLSAQLRTLPTDLRHRDSLSSRLGRLARKTGKPVVAVVDAGEPFDGFARELERHGLPVFRSMDVALRCLGTVASARLASGAGEGRGEENPTQSGEAVGAATA